MRLPGALRRLQRLQEEGLLQHGEALLRLRGGPPGRGGAPLVLPLGDEALKRPGRDSGRPTPQIRDSGSIHHVYVSNPWAAEICCERNHELVRYALPKGKSFDGLTQERVNSVFGGVNSITRASKGHRTPCETAEQAMVKAFLDALGVRKLDKRKVRLQPIIWPLGARPGVGIRTTAAFALT